MSQEDTFELNLYEEVCKAMDLDDLPNPFDLPLVRLTEQGEVVLEGEGAGTSHPSIDESMVTETQSGKYILCCKNTDEPVSLLSIGLSTLLEQCLHTGRLDLVDILTLYPDKQHAVHGSYRRSVAYESRKTFTTIAGDKKKIQRLTRSMTGEFSFKDMCFLCGELVSGSKDVRKVLSGGEFDTGIRDFMRERGYDEWALTVQGRMDSVSDLFSADALYHRVCHTRF